MANVTIIGFKEFEKKVFNLNKEVRQDLSFIVASAGKAWKELAKKDSPRDYGVIARGIEDKPNGLISEVSSNAAYSQFMEWGTKRRRKVPSDLSSYAASLTYTKTGDYYDFLNSILDWVKRKGIGVTYSVATRRKNRQSKDEYLAIAQAIADSISRHGVKPHPFFFKHRDVVYKDMMAKIKVYLNKPK